MTVSSVKTGEVGLSFALNNNFMEPIATTLVGSGGTNNITFNDIPQTYKHLQLRIIGRTNRSLFRDFFGFNINGDYANNYAMHYLSGNGSTASAAAVSSFGEIQFAWAGAANANNSSSFGASIIDIVDYSNTSKNKTLRCLSGFDDNGQGEIQLASGLWLSTDPVTAITVTPGVGTLTSQYSRFSLYGIKG